MTRSDEKEDEEDLTNPRNPVTANSIASVNDVGPPAASRAGFERGMDGGARAAPTIKGGIKGNH